MDATRFEKAMECAWADFVGKFPAAAAQPNARAIFESGFGQGAEFGWEIGKTAGVASVGRRETEVEDAKRN